MCACWCICWGCVPDIWGAYRSMRPKFRQLWTTQYRYWEQNSHPLGELTWHWTVEPSLQTHFVLFLRSFPCERVHSKVLNSLFPLGFENRRFPNFSFIHSKVNQKEEQQLGHCFFLVHLCWKNKTKNKTKQKRSKTTTTTKILSKAEVSGIDIHVLMTTTI